MHAILASVALIGAALAAPAKHIRAAPAPASTLPDGFPSFSTAQLNAVEDTAHGTLPNGGTPPAGSISDLGITNVEFIGFNENFEVFFFNSLIENITNNVWGYDIPNPREKAFIIQALTATKAQEELHATLATALLASQGKDAIVPCKYQFGATTFKEAIKTAVLFNDVVLGTLQDVEAKFALAEGDQALIPGVASVIGQEGEQNGFYRLLERHDLIPSALPFLTRSTTAFAFSALNQNFVVPGSCPNSANIDLPIFGTLLVTSPEIIASQDQILCFSFDISTQSAKLATKGPNMSNYKTYDYTQLSLQYINQQNLPIESEMLNVQITGTVVTFTADFPASACNLNDLTLAAIALGQNFTSVQAVSDATLFGPGLIDVN